MTVPSRSGRRVAAIAPLALAAAAAVALGAGGCGSSGGSSSGSSGTGTTVELNLKAGGNAYDVVRCGITHHYTTYGAGHRIEYAGQITPFPSGHWDAKVKVEQCNGSSFDAVRQAHARGQANGYVSSFLPPVGSGYFFARLYYYQGKNSSSQSDKEYFKVR